MRIRELIAEETIGTTGSTTGQPGTVQSVSQAPGTTPPATNPDGTPKATDPNQEQFAKLLMPYGIKDPADLNNASAALQTAMKSPDQLKPAQQAILGKLVNPLLKNQGFAAALKGLSIQKPGQPPVGQAPTAPVQPPGAPV